MFCFPFVQSRLSSWHIARSLILTCALSMTACTGNGHNASPPEATMTEYEKPGFFSNLSLFGNNKNTDTPVSGLGINSYLWRATLDTISFLPLNSADPLGGVIISDWYSTPQTPHERIKVTVYILDKRLRADGLRIHTFRQIHDKKNGVWVDAETSEETARKLENAILTQARKMRIAHVDASN